MATVTCEIDDGESSGGGGGSDINVAAVVGTAAAVCALVLGCLVARHLKTRKSKKAADAAKQPSTPPEIVPDNAETQ